MDALIVRCTCFLPAAGCMVSHLSNVSSTAPERSPTHQTCSIPWRCSASHRSCVRKEPPSKALSLSPSLQRLDLIANLSLSARSLHQMDPLHGFTRTCILITRLTRVDAGQVPNSLVRLLISHQQAQGPCTHCTVLHISQAAQQDRDRLVCSTKAARLHFSVANPCPPILVSLRRPSTTDDVFHRNRVLTSSSPSLCTIQLR